jgi:hypothetical protein
MYFRKGIITTDKCLKKLCKCNILNVFFVSLLLLDASLLAQKAIRHNKYVYTVYGKLNQIGHFQTVLYTKQRPPVVQL